MQLKNNVLISSGFFISFIILASLSYLIVPNSDNMSSLLISLDMAKGNFLLDGWNLSTQPYIFSDIIWTAIIIKIFGYSQYLANILPAIFFVFTLLFSMKTVSGNAIKLDTFIKFIPFFIIPAFYTAQVTVGLNIHGGIYLAASIFLYYFSKTEKKSNFIVCLFIIISILFGSSDNLYTYIFLIPLFLASMVYAAKSRSTEYLKISLSAFTAIIGVKIAIHYQLNLFNYKIPGEMNPTLADIKTIWKNIAIFTKGLGLYFGVNEYQDKLGFQNIFRMILALSFITATVFSILKRSLSSFTDLLLALCVIIPVAAFIFSTAPVDASSSRYFFYSFLTATILIIRTLKLNLLSHKKFTYLFFIIIIPLNINDISINISQRAREPLGLSTFLFQNGLNRGYATFWSAAVNAAPNAERMIVAPIAINQFVSPFLFLSKNDWYQNKNDFNFILTKNENDSIVAIDQIGPPNKTLHFKGTNILVWDRVNFDIKEYDTMKKSITNIPTIVGEYKKNEIITTGKAGPLAFGPYMELCKGKFILKIKGDVMQGNPYIDVRSMENNISLYSDHLLNDERTMKNINFEVINGCINDIEILITVNESDIFSLQGYSVKKID